MSPIALPHALAPCPPALWEKGVKWHRQRCSLIADIILLRKICIALFSSQTCQMDRFWFFLAEGMKDQGSGFAPPLALPQQVQEAPAESNHFEQLKFQVWISSEKCTKPGSWWQYQSWVVVSYLQLCCDSQLAQVYSPQVRQEALLNATSLCCILSC